MTMGLVFLEVFLIFTFFSFTSLGSVLAGIGQPNTTVITQLEIGNVFPDVINVSIDDDAETITLTPNATTTVNCIAIIRDYNGDSDIAEVNATFYDSVASSSNDADDNNYHYTNSSCELIADTGEYNGYADDPYHSMANCTFELEYYANPQDWICNVTVADNVSWTGSNTDSITVSQLLAIGVPDTIDYGTVNATYVSDESIANITNYGNMVINLSLEGYGVTQGDGTAMNCTLGNIGNISIDYEKYNLTSTTAGALSLSEFEATYINLSSTAIIKQFELGVRLNDTFNEAINSTYWRIYVPRGVAGTCDGTIIFGATVAEGN